ncbi:MAG: DUF2279 domain-containing protein [Bacteroidota bacterium]
MAFTLLVLLFLALIWVGADKGAAGDILNLFSGRGMRSGLHADDSLDPGKETREVRRTRRLRLWLFWIAVTGVVTLGMLIMNKMWYATDTARTWHWFNDNAEWLQMDKAGHFFTVFTTSRIVMHALKNLGLTPLRAAAFASMASFLSMSPVEYFDGFEPAYGASKGDIIANASGALALFLQIRIWGRVVIAPKFSFWQSGFAPLRPEVLGNSFAREMLKDYNGQTYWLNIPLNRLMPPAARLFPEWLNLSVGQSAENMVYGREFQNLAHGFHPYRQILLSVNIGLTKTPLWKKHGHRLPFRAVAYWFEVVQMPFPALEVGQNGLRLHWLYI